MFPVFECVRQRVGVKRMKKKKSYRHGTTGILVPLIAFPACQVRHSARGMKAYKEHGTSRTYKLCYSESAEGEEKKNLHDDM